MTADATLWARYCRLLLTHPELGFSLDFSRIRFPDDFLAKMRPAAEAALQAMQKIEKGAIANQDEKRMVGHYWLRAPELAPEAALTNDIIKAVADVEAFAKKVHAGELKGAKGPFTHVLSLGIGGSALGPELVAHAVGSASDKLIPVFINNTDPDGIDDVVRSLEGQLGQTLVVVMSKSGGTPETRNAMLEVEAAYKKAGIPFGQHAVAITQAGSALDKTAVAGGWLARFPMWDWVGGRTSVMSTVGLVPAALQGIDIKSFLEGAKKMDVWTRVADVEQNPAMMMALMWYFAGDGHGKKDMVVLPYKDRLVLFSRYLQQLVMESLGKKLDRHGKVVEQGIAVYGNKGSTDQHAYVQQLRDGLKNFFVTFIQVLHDRAGSSIEVEPNVTSGDYLFGFLEGTRAALYDTDRDSVTLTIGRVTPESLGALIALYERTVGLYAELIDINAYHQPGVEAGKKAAAEVLALQAKVVAQLAASKSPATAEAVAQSIGVSDVETVWKILEHLAANGRGVKRSGGASPQDSTFAAG